MDIITGVVLVEVAEITCVVLVVDTGLVMVQVAGVFCLVPTDLLTSGGNGAG